MASADREVVNTIRSLMRRVKRNKSIDLDTSLFSEGLGLDSLETAELSAMLEDQLGSDPFSTGEMPETVQDIVDFYEAPTSEQ